MIFSTLFAGISPWSNTSKPRRSGARTSAALINSVLPWGPFTTSEIRRRAALLPISIAANLNVYGCLGFFIKIFIGFYLATDLFSSGIDVIITELIVQPSRFYIIV